MKKALAVMACSVMAVALSAGVCTAAEDKNG